MVAGVGMAVVAGTRVGVFTVALATRLLHGAACTLRLVTTAFRLSQAGLLRWAT